MIKKKFLILLLALSLVNAQNMVQLKQKNGREVSGDFIGTYGGYVHLLIDGELILPKGIKVTLNINEFSGSNSESL